MEISIYKNTFSPTDAIENFLDFYYSSKMCYLAGDLLSKGLTPDQISDAVLNAMKAVSSSGNDVREHFMLVFSQRNNEMFKDCKLSKMGYALVLLNADVEVSLVGKWQIKVLEKFLD
ncbi:hypothetical protein [Olleya namhaensis]|uniref:hypothetical protein n=1 Tax=Olleya namhaensis TaxID=1144750 RepID=UPI00232F6ECC|nr:hypothetical protein [Olleya namhaensis]